MSITSACTECGAESSGTGGIVHATTCSAVSLAPQVGYGLKPPAIELKFGSKAEQEKIMANLKSTKVSGMATTDPDTSKDSSNPPRPAKKTEVSNQQDKTPTSVSSTKPRPTQTTPDTKALNGGGAEENTPTPVGTNDDINNNRGEAAALNNPTKALREATEEILDFNPDELTGGFPKEVREYYIVTIMELITAQKIALLEELDAPYKTDDSNASLNIKAQGVRLRLRKRLNQLKERG